MAFLWSIKNSS